ncbi:hypothetical protein [Methylobacterium fujisawaense]|uniref:hypothetical protein n=1 Tax=Methylobacterium fujisawaense TaxID=107400 RepID=UPI00313CFA38
MALGLMLGLMLGLPLAEPAGAQDGPPAPRVASAVKNLRFVPLAALPRAPGGAGRQAGCPGEVVPAQSEAAQAVAARDWFVTGEAALGRYRAVSFASDLQQGTSGTCLIADGNVGLFDGTRLVALVYGAGRTGAVGRIAARAGGVRLWDGDLPPSPVGDLTLRPDGTLSLEPLPAVESVCGGRGAVPAIRGQPIDTARAALIAAGWTPVKGPPSDDARERDLARRGVIEVDGCSGTGLAYCSFRYAGAAGALSVTTTGDGDLPEVHEYGVTCR